MMLYYGREQWKAAAAGLITIVLHVHHMASKTRFLVARRWETLSGNIVDVPTANGLVCDPSRVLTASLYQARKFRDLRNKVLQGGTRAELCWPAPDPMSDVLVHKEAQGVVDTNAASGVGPVSYTHLTLPTKA